MQRFDIEDADQCTCKTQDQIKNQLAQIGKEQIGQGEEVCEAENRHVERVGDERADDAGDERIAFEVVAVEDFNAGDGCAQGSVKNSAQSPGRAGQ